MRGSWMVCCLAGLAALGSGGCPVDPCNIFNCDTLFFIEALFAGLEASGQQTDQDAGPHADGQTDGDGAGATDERTDADGGAASDEHADGTASGSALATDRGADAGHAEATGADRGPTDRRGAAEAEAAGHEPG